MCCVFFFQAEDGIRDLVRSRGLGDVYKRQDSVGIHITPETLRQLARLVLPAKAGDPLAYDLALDPELRRIFGFGAPLPLSLIHI